MSGAASEDARTVRPKRYRGAWSEDDPHAAFKQEVADYTRMDPLPAFDGLAELTGIPVDALVRYALCRWAAEGAEALLAMGPRTVERMWSIIEQAEQSGDDHARLEAYERLRGIVSWLRAGTEG